MKPNEKSILIWYKDHKMLRTWTRTFPLIFVLSISSLFAQKSLDVQEIIDKCISVHGGDKVKSGAFGFDFRKYSYTYNKEGDTFSYSRQHKETGIKDILNNDGMKRFDGDEEIQLSTKDQGRYGNSVNSVIYFAFLPYFLNDAAVHKELLEEASVNGKNYYKIRVTFSKESGGDDFDDLYFYWINKQTFALDYLAYSFHVNGGGVRFREAYNIREVGGVRFQDYVNYKHDKTTPVGDLDELFENEELIELSKIELENIRIL